MIILGSVAAPRAVAGGGDEYWDNVVLLVDAESGLVDLSNAGRTLTADFGKVTISTEQAKFGTKSVKFPGTSQARVSFSDSADWDFGTGDFTLETWAYRGSAGVHPLLILGDAATADNGLDWIWNSDGRMYVGRNNGTTISSNVTLANSTWHHLAVSRESGVIYFAANGSIISSAAFTYSFTPSAGSNNSRFALGYDRLDTVFSGYMDQFRITKGVGRYTSSYTTPTEPFPQS